MIKLKELIAKYPGILDSVIDADGDEMRYGYLTLTVPNRVCREVEAMMEIRRGRALKLLDHLEEQGYEFKFVLSRQTTVAFRTDELNEIPFTAKAGYAVTSGNDFHDDEVGKAIAAARAVEAWDDKTNNLFWKLVCPGL